MTPERSDVLLAIYGVNGVRGTAGAKSAKQLESGFPKLAADSRRQWIPGLSQTPATTP